MARPAQNGSQGYVVQEEGPSCGLLHLSCNQDTSRFLYSSRSYLLKWARQLLLGSKKVVHRLIYLKVMVANTTSVTFTGNTTVNDRFRKIFLCLLKIKLWLEIMIHLEQKSTLRVRPNYPNWLEVAGGAWRTIQNCKMIMPTTRKSKAPSSSDV